MTARKKSRIENAANRAATAAARAARLAQEAREEAIEDKTLEEGPASDVRELLSGLPAEAEIKLYKMIPGTAKSEFCEAFAEPGEFNENTIRQKWGGGTFRLLIRVPDEKGRMVWPRTGAGKVFRIAMPANGAAPIVAEKPKSWEDTMAMQLFSALMAQQAAQAQAMRESQESHRAMIAMMLGNNNKPDTSLEFFKVMLPVLVPPKADPMELALKVAAMLKPAGPAAGIVEQMAMLEKFLAIIKRGEGGGAERPVWFEALKEVAPLIQQAFQAPKASPQLPPGAPAAPAPAPSPAPAPIVAQTGAEPPIPPPLEAPVIHPLLASLDRMMPVLIESAALNLSHDLQADWVLERIPDDYFDGFAGFIEGSGVLDQLMSRYPAAAVYRTWFEGLIVAIRAAIEAAPMEEVEPDPAAPEPQLVVETAPVPKKKKGA